MITLRPKKLKMKFHADRSNSKTVLHSARKREQSDKRLNDYDLYKAIQYESIRYDRHNKSVCEPIS